MPIPNLSVPHRLYGRSSTPSTKTTDGNEPQHHSTNIFHQTTRTVTRRLAHSSSSPQYIAKAPPSYYQDRRMTSVEMTFLAMGLLAVVGAIVWLSMLAVRNLQRGCSAKMRTGGWDYESAIEGQKGSKEFDLSGRYNSGYKIISGGVGHYWTGEESPEEAQARILGRRMSALGNCIDVDGRWTRASGRDGSASAARSRSNSQAMASGKRFN